MFNMEIVQYLAQTLIPLRRIKAFHCTFSNSLHITAEKDFKLGEESDSEGLIHEIGPEHVEVHRPSFGVPDNYSGRETGE